MRKTTLREIKNSLGRYLAIFAIVALGVGFFSGLKVCKPSMIKTGDKYLKDTQFFDYRLLSTLGFEKDDVKAFQELDSVANARTSVSADVICINKNTTESVLVAHTLLEDINTLKIISGRLPQSADECVLDANNFSEDFIGTDIIISDNNPQDVKDKFAYDVYKVVGLAKSPYYLNYERGNTSIGNGKIAAFMYILRDGFDCEYETEIFLKMNQSHVIYSKEYDDYIETHKDEIENVLEQIANDRYQSIKNDADMEIADAQDELDKGKRELQDAKDKLENEVADARKELEEALEKLQDGEKQISEAKKEIEDGEKSISEGLIQLKTKEDELTQSLAQLEEAIKQVEPYIEYSPEQKAVYEQMLANKAMITAGQEEIRNKKAQIYQKQSSLKQAREEIADKEQEIKDGYDEYNDGISELESKVADANAEIADAQKEIEDGEKKLADAKTELEDLKEPSTYCMDRNTNTGYVCFDSDTSIVDDIASVFPIFFFAVAALVCMTTMTRMVEDQRTQIGVLKALGYSNARIAGKYLFYAGSAAISGAIVGYIVFCYAFPKIIWIAYGMMYDFAELTYDFVPIYAVISLVAAMLCSMGATFLSCSSQFMELPSNLIRPKSPKAGKRIILERIGFIWRRLSFLHKVSIRNVFRYKKRFIMMVLGISGCTALLLTGFGLSDSIKGVLNDQYGTVSTHDVQISLAEEITDENIDDIEKLFNGCLESYSLLAEKNMDVSFDGSSREAVIRMPEDASSFVTKYHLLDYKTNKELPYPKDGEIVVTEKMARKLRLDIGDVLTVSDSDFNEFTAVLVGISKNHMGDFGFVTKATYINAVKQTPEVKSALGDVKDTLDKHEVVARLLDNDKIATITLTDDFKERFDNMIKSLDYVIVTIVVCAAALAFIVLYNLTNINITERIREIATIKVLGFFGSETSAYVFRENLMLTGFGALMGLVLGRILHIYVMYKIDVAMVYFGHDINVSSFVWSIILTFVFAFMVNIVMYFKLEKINMAESLKSIE